MGADVGGHPIFGGEGEGAEGTHMGLLPSVSQQMVAEVSADIGSVVTVGAVV